MSLIKRILLGLLGLLLLIVLISFVLPGTAHIERSIVINAPAPRVFRLVNDLRTYDEWMPWNRKDPQMTKTFTGPETGAGASYSWKSNDKQVGNGTLTIVQSVPNQQVTTALDFGEMGVSYGGWLIQSQDTNTRIVWYMDAKMTGPNFLYNVVSKYMGLFMDKMVGPDFEQGLDSLKSIAERTPDPKLPTVNVEQTAVKPQVVLYVLDSATSGEDLAVKLARIYGAEIGSFLKKNGLQMTGAPMAWYAGAHFPMTFDAGIPVDKAPTATEGRIRVRRTNGGPAVVAHFFGPYEMDTLGYSRLSTWIKQNGKTASGLPYEVYVGDPGLEKDPYKVQTDIYQDLAR